MTQTKFTEPSAIAQPATLPAKAFAALSTNSGLAPFTVARRVPLLAEQLTFQNLVEEACREMAQHYLQQSSLELDETGYLFGYGDPNSFIRAFHQWEGTSPSEWRAARCPAAS
jgi:AraC-like DNA-binding protein